ncbi:MAG TPA: hypothetical protein VKB75_03655 [Jatrophihabitans sp.]|nr:hypothetical protein [Jatrophihabitans sp.]
MTENPGAGAGAVLLDIGGDVGAVVVAAPAHLAGAEIEICPEGRRSDEPDEGRGWWAGEWRAHPSHVAWPHVAVLRRRTPTGAQFAAVFPGLRAGSYELWLRPAQPTAVVVSVAGGEVTSIAWPKTQAG